MSRKGVSKLFCRISLIQICNTTWDKAGDMPSVVIAIIAVGRNWTIDYNAGKSSQLAESMSKRFSNLWLLGKADVAVGDALL